jgi:hypothetical protein
MPPRFAYWTILIDGGPTAFRARFHDELLPTLRQLQRTNPNVVMKWFARGRLWASPEEARDALRPPRREARGQAWHPPGGGGPPRPGGNHSDPRAGFARSAKTRRRPGGRKPRRRD